MSAVGNANGSSLATTVTVAVAIALSVSPSLTVTLTMRSPATGFCEVFENRTSPIAVCMAANDAGPERYIVITPATAGPKLDVMPAGKALAIVSASPICALVSLTVAPMTGGPLRSATTGLSAMATGVPAVDVPGSVKVVV